ncbi:MAG: hypothetical protein K2X27_24145 [Candidatus Obscuribacterales bacterium]|nr:hypothetical protein [Candidatus Obscuribacterales bacterium]
MPVHSPENKLRPAAYEITESPSKLTDEEVLKQVSGVKIRVRGCGLANVEALYNIFLNVTVIVSTVTAAFTFHKALIAETLSRRIGFGIKGASAAGLACFAQTLILNPQISAFIFSLPIFGA